MVSGPRPTLPFAEVYDGTAEGRSGVSGRSTPEPATRKRPHVVASAEGGPRSTRAKESPRPERLLVCHCGAPLIATFHWRVQEWVCIECGSLYEFFGPNSVTTTDLHWERYLALLAEWEENAGPKLLTPGARHEGCEKCWGDGSEAHEKHATAEERAAHEEATAWLLTRTGRA